MYTTAPKEQHYREERVKEVGEVVSGELTTELIKSHP